MEDLEIFADALPDFCTECNGTGRDAFSSGALWCGACRGKGTRKEQLVVYEEKARLKKFMDELIRKKD